MRARGRLKALRYMKRAGYDPRGMVEFLQVLRSVRGVILVRCRRSSHHIPRPPIASLGCSSKPTASPAAGVIHKRSNRFSGAWISCQQPGDDLRLSIATSDRSHEARETRIGADTVEQRIDRHERLAPQTDPLRQDGECFVRLASHGYHCEAAQPGNGSSSRVESAPSPHWRYRQRGAWRGRGWPTRPRPEGSRRQLPRRPPRVCLLEKHGFRDNRTGQRSSGASSIARRDSVTAGNRRP